MSRGGCDGGTAPGGRTTSSSSPDRRPSPSITTRPARAQPRRARARPSPTAWRPEGRAGRRPDSSALAVLIPTAALLPVSLVALAAFWLVVRLVAPVPYWAFAAGYLAAGVLMFLRPVQRLLLSWLYGARRPTPDELDRLEPAWHDVLRQAGLPARRFVLAVTDSPELNAYACGGHVVAVSTAALELLPDDELHGVLAHELGHHLGLHTVALTITHWLSLPIITLARIGFLLERLAFAASDLLARRSAGLALIGRIVSAILQVIALAFLATVLIARRIGDRLGRSSEFTADERAVDMGYGRHLVHGPAPGPRHGPAGGRAERAAPRLRRPPLTGAADGEDRGAAAGRPGLTHRPSDARSGRQQLPHPSGRPPDDRHARP